jgi:hypothetical protein
MGLIGKRELTMIHKLFLVALLCVAVSPALAARGSSDEEAACRPDVRRFCHTIKEGRNFLGCLHEHRAKLRPACRNVLKSHGL